MHDQAVGLWRNAIPANEPILGGKTKGIRTKSTNQIEITKVH